MSTFPSLSGIQLIKALRHLGFEISGSREVITSSGTPTDDARWCQFTVARA